jgi:uncharacterized RDD family membrane protein YckC
LNSNRLKQPDNTPPNFEFDKTTSSAPGLLRRLAVMFYDATLLIAVLFTATALILPLNNGDAFTSHHFFLPVYLLIIGFIFYGWFWTHGGQTLGLRAWKLQVQSIEGYPITWKQALIRYFAAFLSWGVFGLGFLWVAFNPEKLAWHDFLSGTKVSFNENQGSATK